MCFHRKRMKTVMAKYKVKTRDCQLIVGVRLSLKEKNQCYAIRLLFKQIYQRAFESKNDKEKSY